MVITLNRKQILRNYIWVVAFNLVTITVGIGINFLLPVQLTILDYALWKEYLLIFTFAGFLNLGLVDGLYLEWGGKDFEGLKKSIPSFLLAVILISVLITPIYLLVVLIIFDDFLFFTMLALNSIAFNIFGFLVKTFNATGKHSYANVLNLTNRTLFLISIIITSAAKTDLVILLSTSSYLSVVILALLFLWLKGFRVKTVKLTSLFHSTVQIIKTGAPVLITNLLQLVVFNLDLVMVRIIGTPEQFAFYGFTVTVIKTVLILATSGKTVLFPALKNKTTQLYNHKTNWEFPMVIMVIVGSALAYFILPLIIERFVPNYTNSLDFILILLAALPFLFLIMSLQTTQLLSENRQVTLLKNTLAAILLGLILNLPGIFLRNLHLIAYASVATYFLYYLINRVSIGHGMKIIQVSLSLIATIFLLFIGQIISLLGFFVVLIIIIVLAIYLIIILFK